MSVVLGKAYNLVDAQLEQGSYNVAFVWMSVVQLLSGIEYLNSKLVFLLQACSYSVLFCGVRQTVCLMFCQTEGHIMRQTVGCRLCSCPEALSTSIASKSSCDPYVAAL